MPWFCTTLGSSSISITHRSAHGTMFGAALPADRDMWRFHVATGPTAHRFQTSTHVCESVPLETFKSHQSSKCRAICGWIIYSDHLDATFFRHLLQKTSHGGDTFAAGTTSQTHTGSWDGTRTLTACQWLKCKGTSCWGSSACQVRKTITSCIWKRRWVCHHTGVCSAEVSTHSTLTCVEVWGSGTGLRQSLSERHVLPDKTCHTMVATLLLCLCSCCLSFSSVLFVVIRIKLQRLPTQPCVRLQYCLCYQSTTEHVFPLFVFISFSVLFLFFFPPFFRKMSWQQHLPPELAQWRLCNTGTLKREQLSPLITTIRFSSGSLIATYGVRSCPRRGEDFPNLTVHTRLPQSCFVVVTSQQ